MQVAVILFIVFIVVSILLFCLLYHVVSLPFDEGFLCSCKLLCFNFSLHLLVQLNLILIPVCDHWPAFIVV